MKIGYKLVRQDGDRLVSCFENGNVLEYAVGKETVPLYDDGPLGAFWNKWLAKDFFRKVSEWGKNKKIKLYKCKYDPSQRTGFWYEKDDGVHSEPSLGIPRGTVYARSLTLLEEIT